MASEYASRSPPPVVRMLELADGTCLTESWAILRYHELTYPQPNLARWYQMVKAPASADA